MGAVAGGLGGVVVFQSMLNSSRYTGVMRHDNDMETWQSSPTLPAVMYPTTPGATKMLIGHLICNFVGHNL